MQTKHSTLVENHALFFQTVQSILVRILNLFSSNSTVYAIDIVLSNDESDADLRR